MPVLAPLQEGTIGSTTVVEGSVGSTTLSEGIQTLAALAEQDNVTIIHRGLYPSLGSFPSASTFPSPGMVIPGAGPVNDPLAEGALALVPLQEG